MTRPFLHNAPAVPARFNLGETLNIARNTDSASTVACQLEILADQIRRGRLTVRASVAPSTAPVAVGLLLEFSVMDDLS